MLDSVRKWIKEPANKLAAALVLISATVIMVVAFTSDTGPARSERPALPVCVHEDASGQSACYWDASRFGSDHPDAYVFESGKITYYPHTGELAVWDDKINDVVTYKIND